MKQTISKIDWNKLSPKQKIDFWKALFPNDEVLDMHVPVVPVSRINEITFGNLIEYLGDDLEEICKRKDWLVYIRNKELIKALFNACVYKLDV